MGAALALVLGEPKVGHAPPRQISRGQLRNLVLEAIKYCREEGMPVDGGTLVLGTGRANLLHAFLQTECVQRVAGCGWLCRLVEPIVIRRVVHSRRAGHRASGYGSRACGCCYREEKPRVLLLKYKLRVPRKKKSLLEVGEAKEACGVRKSKSKSKIRTT